MQKLSFELEEDQCWYVVLPEYLAAGGTKGDLQMVLGADQMLDELSKYTGRVTIQFDSEPFADAMVLEKMVDNDIGAGAFYMTPEDIGVPKIWLCEVNAYVWGGYHPEQIYFKVVG